LICFIDDDNIPDSDYLSNGFKVFTNKALAMAISRVYPNWEVRPPPSVYRRRHLFAINDYNGDSPIDFHELIAPTISAGMWVRRPAFLEAVPWRQPDRLMAGRVGGSLNCGEDIELGILMGKAGYQRRYEPSLRIRHEIPRNRLETGYVKRLILGIIRSELTFREKYADRVGFGHRVAAAGKLILAVCAIPLFPLFKSDWRRETVFVMADRWARVRGPELSKQ